MRPKDKTFDTSVIKIRKAKSYINEPESPRDFGSLAITQYFGAGISIGEFQIRIQRYKSSQFRAHIKGPKFPKVLRLDVDPKLSINAGTDAYRRIHDQKR